MNETVTLTLTREHAETVQDACELLMRLKLGQTSFPTELMLGWPNSEMSVQEYCLRRDIANDALKAFLRAVDNAEGTEKDELEQMAYEVWDTIRHALWKRENLDGGDSWSVCSQPPLSESGLKMPVCEIREG